MKKIVIAVDGYSSCGKSTLAKQLSEELNYIYLDTGAMYRSVALYALQNQYDSKELIQQLDKINITFQKDGENGKANTYLNGKNVEKEIRTMEVSNKVSEVSAIKEVRQKLVKEQKKLGKDKGIVLDGRDIGTVVFPHAELKIFMTADTDVRAQRRFKELRDKGESHISFEEVKENLKKRDYLDTTRNESPLKKADDAKILDNTSINRSEQLEVAVKWAKEKISKQ